MKKFNYNTTLIRDADTGQFKNIPALSGDCNVKIIRHGTDDISVAIDPNQYHVWGEVLELNISLNNPVNQNIVNEFMFSFVSGATATQLTLPSTVKGIPVIEPNSKYEMSIVDNCLAYGRWDV